LSYLLNNFFDVTAETATGKVSQSSWPRCFTQAISERFRDATWWSSTV